MTRETKNATVAALRSTKKGQLKYDYFWEQEGRTQTIVEEISAHITRLSVSPKALQLLQLNESGDWTSEHTTTSSDDDFCPTSISCEEKPVITETEDKLDPHTFEAISKTELSLIEYEEDRKRAVMETVERKRADIENRTKELERQVTQQYQLLKRKSELEAMRKSAELQQLQEEYYKVAREKELLEKERHSTQAKRKSAIMKEVELKQRQAEEQLQKREKEQSERKQQLVACQSELLNCTARTKDTLDSCEHKKYLQIPCEERYNQMNNVLSAVKVVVEESHARDVGIDDLIKAQQLFDNAQMIYKSVSEDIEQARNRGVMEMEQMKSRQVSGTSAPGSRNRSRQVSGSSVKHSAELSDMTVEEMQASELKHSVDDSEGKDLPIYNCIAPDALQEYSAIMEKWESWDKKNCQPFTSDIKNKTYIFNVRKAITTPINAISGQSGSHVRDKLDRLLKFLSGQSVEVLGKHVSCKNNLPALAYSKGIIAQQFVSQGENQIASQFSSAFPFAAAMVGLWVNHPDVGPLILSCFYKKCPYLVPYYPPREGKQSDVEYYKSLGYKYDGDTIEKKDKFLKRMSGYMRLYAAIIQSPIPPGCKGPHPHGVEWGWKWLTRVLNLEPRPDITATLLFDFLEVAGHTLQKTYGNQFQKILHVLCKDYFPKIEYVTSSGSAGPLVRLKDFLHNAIKKRLIPPPDGVLLPSFFYT